MRLNPVLVNRQQTEILPIMTTRKFTVTFDVSDSEFENFMVRLGGGAVLNKEIPRNTTVTSEEVGDGDEGEAITGTTDKFGVTWDARYHSTTKNTNKDGSWKRVKGLSDAAKAEADVYEAAQKAAAVTVAAPVVPLTLPVAETAPVVAETVAAPVVGLPTGLPTGAAPIGLPMPVAPVTPPPVTYEEVVAKYQAVAAVNPGAVADYVALYASVGITDPNALQTDETLRRKLFDKLTELTPVAA
jgi:hypothetical protein